MKKNFEYKEPEFKVVIANCEDVLTASGGLPEGTLSSVTRRRSWDTATWDEFGGSFTL